MTIIFNGVETASYTISWKEARATDGVYGIYQGLPIPYKSILLPQELDGVAIVMYGRAMQISHNHSSLVYWGNDNTDISGIENLSIVGGGVSGNIGYLPKPDGSYYTTTESYKIKVGYANWLSYSNTALADTAGWNHSEAMITSQKGLGGTITYFRNTSSNQGYSDWFVPAMGQLAFIWLNKDEINTLLEKCGANPIPCEKRAYDHWSSAEYHAYSAWTLNFTGGSIGTMSKFDNEALTQAYVRYCRDITE